VSPNTVFVGNHERCIIYVKTNSTHLATIAPTIRPKSNSTDFCDDRVQRCEQNLAPRPCTHSTVEQALAAFRSPTLVEGEANRKPRRRQERPSLCKKRRTSCGAGSKDERKHR